MGSTSADGYEPAVPRVREQGDWEPWLEFFLAGVAETSEQATETGRRILALFDQDGAKVEALGRSASSVLRVHQLLQTKPLSIPAAAKRLGLSQPTITKASSSPRAWR